MDAHLQAKIAFHLTGNRARTHLGTIDEPPLVPALFAGYRELTTLRYDFPVVLVEGRRAGGYAESMSALVDGILERTAEGPDADRIRQHVLRLESAIRARVACGVPGMLSEHWDAVAGTFADALVVDSLLRARRNLDLDGRVVDCDDRLPARLVTHAWEIAQDKRAKALNEIVERLTVRLSDVLKSDFLNSAEGRTAENLRPSFGTGPMDAFDFEAMSLVLSGSAPSSLLTDQRRKRIQWLLSVLESQRFVATKSSTNDVYEFAFDSCGAALEAFSARLPRAIELAKAISIGELEVKGEYDESKHDLIFESFASNGLDTRYLTTFPDYLVTLNVEKLLADEHEQFFDILSADLPFKILVQTDDILEESAVGDGHLAFSLRSRSLASTAMGLTGVFVLQSPSSALLPVSEQVQHGLDYPGPALFSIFSGSGAAQSGTPAYLLAAAALESRVFPVFVYDPSAGQDWATRFSLAGNPQPELDWPLHDFSYQDASCQTVSEAVQFTLADFVACDARYASHFACVPQGEWSENLVPVSEVVDLSRREKVDRVPSILMVDPQDALQRVVVDEKLIRESRRCLSLWHSLQELAGIHNSHAERAVVREQSVWQARLQQELAAASPESGPAPVAAQVAETLTEAAASADVAPAEPERSPDEAYIETLRCSTCNECTQINGKLFAYNENQQAYILDINAGSYAQMVEAAESCQVSVIHPGKPRNPKEAGLEDLLKRAELFA